MRILLAVITLFMISTGTLFSVSENKIRYRHSVDLFPLAPLIDIYGAHYLYRVSKRSALITGLAYMQLEKDSGTTHSPAIITGYRFYIWKNLHMEYELWFCYDRFYEKNEQKNYRGFDLWNEFRIGYRFDFAISGVPFYVNIQWPFGFGLYSSNKPQSFLDEVAADPFFYQIPMLFVGMRF